MTENNAFFTSTLEPVRRNQVFTQTLRTTGDVFEWIAFSISGLQTASFKLVLGIHSNRPVLTMFCAKSREKPSPLRRIRADSIDRIFGQSNSSTCRYQSPGGHYVLADSTHTNFRGKNVSYATGNKGIREPATRKSKEVRNQNPIHRKIGHVKHLAGRVTIHPRQHL